MTPGLLKAQNPIPSWNVPVYFRANFQELNKGISIEIDENEWGVLVESEEHLVVDVWIEESKSPVKIPNKNPEYRTKKE